MADDYCTMAPDGLLGYYWGDKCLIHDKDYWFKGKSRKEADIDLREGMIAKLPKQFHFIAWIYYFFVRIFGGFFWKELN